MCTCVLLYMCICVLMYLCVSVHVHLCTCLIVYLCTCKLVSLSTCELATQVRIHDDSQWFMAIHDNSWQFMSRLVSQEKDISQILRQAQNLMLISMLALLNANMLLVNFTCCPLTIQGDSYDSWQFMKIYDNSWIFMTINNKILAID